MKFLYLILLTTATFCYDSELLNYPQILKAKYELFDEIKKEIYSNPMPNNYKDYLNTLEFSGDFLFDIIPFDNWKHESEKFVLLLADNKEEKDYISKCFILFPFTGRLSLRLKNNKGNNGNFFSNPPSPYVNKFRSLSAKIITTSKGKFVVIICIKAMTVALPNKSSGKVKVCSTTNTVFKKCTEYEIDEAAKATGIAFYYSKIKEKMNAYN